MTTFSTLVAAATSSLGMATFALPALTETSGKQLLRKYACEKISARFGLARLYN